MSYFCLPHLLSLFRPLSLPPSKALKQKKNASLSLFSVFKGYLYDIQSINIAANNYLLCKDILEKYLPENEVTLPLCVL